MPENEIVYPVAPFSDEAAAAMDAQYELLMRNANMTPWPAEDRAEMERLNAILETDRSRREKVQNRINKRIASGGEWVD